MLPNAAMAGLIMPPVPSARGTPLCHCGRYPPSEGTPAVESPVRASPVSALAISCEAGTVQTILIVDDNAGFRVQVRALLLADGFEVVGEAHDGASGIEAARALRPD